MNFDYTWKNRTEEQIALEVMFNNVAVPRKLSKLQACEFVLTAKESMWYYEIRRYADGIYPMDNSRDSVKFFLEGCVNICQIVESGYNSEAKTWWKVEPPANDEDAKKTNRFILAIANALNSLKLTYIRQPLLVEMFECAGEIILGNTWQSDFILPKDKDNHNRHPKSTNKPT